MDSVQKKLMDFIENSPTAFHTVARIRERLMEEGYVELFENRDWELTAPGKYFVVRNGSALMAFHLPKGEIRGYMLYAAHSDSPCLKLKEEPEQKAAEYYTRLRVEKYGGMICSTWLDRPLSLAGRIVVQTPDGVASRLVHIDRDLLLIPSVAIHMERNVNDGKAFNPNVDMLPLYASAEPKTSLRSLIAREAGVEEADILATDLYVYSRTPAALWGGDGEFLSAPRLDDLQCAFAGLEGLIAAQPKDSAAVLCIFDNEEVGSGTKQGADSNFLEQVLYRISASLGKRPEAHMALLSNSFMVSADNGHAVHPNHPEFADGGDRPRMNGGVVIKWNAAQRYTTDAMSAGIFADLCKRAGVPVQRYTNRPDLPGGGTLGNISNAHVSIPTVDVGLAQLAMHSAYETCGAEDAGHMIRAAQALFSSSLEQEGDSVFIR